MISDPTSPAAPASRAERRAARRARRRANRDARRKAIRFWVVNAFRFSSSFLRRFAISAPPGSAPHALDAATALDRLSDVLEVAHDAQDEDEDEDEDDTQVTL